MYQSVIKVYTLNRNIGVTMNTTYAACLHHKFFLSIAHESVV